MDNITIGSILYYTKDYSEADRELILKAYEYAKDKHLNPRKVEKHILYIH